MKKLIVAIVALTMSVTVMAQDARQRRGQEGRQFDRTEMLKQRTNETVEQLGLNEEQAAKLLELNTKFADKLRPQMGGPRPGQPGRRPEANGNRQRPDSARAERPDFEKMRAEMRANQEAYEAELKTILTEDQFKQYKKEEQKRMERMQRGGQRGGMRGQGGPRGERGQRGNRFQGDMD